MSNIKAPTKEITSGDTEVTKFNHNLSLLLFQLSKIYPEDHDLKIYSDKLEWLKKINAKMACEGFTEYAGKFVKEIMTKNETFFMNFNYTTATNNQQYLELIKKIINVWQETENEKLKENIWKYFQTLLTYGAIACKRQDIINELNKYRETPITL